MSDDLRLEADPLDADLRANLRSPALALDPPEDLITGVVRRARRTRQRQVAGAAALALAVAATAVGARAVIGGRAGAPEQVAQQPTSQPLFPEATSAVVALTQLNGGTVYTWFQGGSWCTASVRTGPKNFACAGSVGAARVLPFAYVRRPGEPSVSVDAGTLVTGLLGDGVARVELVLAGGAVRETAAVTGAGFGRTVWWAPVDDRRPTMLVAYSFTGQVLARARLG